MRVSCCCAKEGRGRVCVYAQMPETWRRSVGLFHSSGLPVLASATSHARHETAHRGPEPSGSGGAPQVDKRADPGHCSASLA
jgi:hypothetical protein